MNHLTRIVAAVVDTKKAILYRQDGLTVEILQGDARLRPILEHITPLLSKQGYADVDLSTPNSWKEFEEKTSGTVRFFRIAKSKLKSLFGGKEAEAVEPTVIGDIPVHGKLLNAIDEISKHAVPVASDGFNEDTVAPQRPTAVDGTTPSDRSNDGKEDYFDKHTDTIVAVTKTGKVVPGVERIKSQFGGAVTSNNTKGLEAFLERIGTVIERRRHTVEDLLRFLERGDLPIADDGSIIIYKRLYRRGSHYVDPHTKKVTQQVGSSVYMDESLVDPNRRNECSNGLHVARRGYISQFSGDVIVLAKVQPEDVIAVPDYDANKMRVCRYHIIFELTEDQFKVICANKPLSAASGGEALLYKAITGDHTGIIEYVKIGGPHGTCVSITPVEGAESVQTAIPETPNTDALGKTARPLEADGVGPADKPVDVKRVTEKVKDANVSLSEAAVPKPTTQTEIVKVMWDLALAGDLAKADELLAYKKKTKKGWHVWGLPSSAGDTLKALLED